MKQFLLSFALALASVISMQTDKVITYQYDQSGNRIARISSGSNAPQTKANTEQQDKQ